MRILKVTQSYAPFFRFGGPPVKVRALAERLVRRGHEVTVLTADWGLERRHEETSGEFKPDASPFGRRCRVNGVTAEYLANWMHYRAMSWNPALGRYLRARLNEFDVVHIFGLYDLFGPRVAKECRVRGIPYVVEPIGMYVPIVRNVWLKKMYHALWGREMLEGADAIIATAEQEREELVSGGLAGEKILLRRNGVEVPERLPARGAFRNKLGIAPEAKMVLFLGRLSEKKSPDLLLRAFATVTEKKSTASAETHGTRGDRRGALASEAAHLVFVGPDESGMKERLERMARESGISELVHFCAPVDGNEKWAVYRDADIFVLPSQNENFGNTAAEAVAAGTPVIVTDQCGIAPILKNLAGLVVRHDEAALVAAVKQLLQDQNLYGELQRGCAEAVTRLGWDEPVTTMELIYSRLAGRRCS
jgi:glycosyltransferase involved in cell wall biosynthesis